jgi:hypothetical protein
LFLKCVITNCRLKYEKRRLASAAGQHNNSSDEDDVVYANKNIQPVDENSIESASEISEVRTNNNNKSHGPENLSKSLFKKDINKCDQEVYEK